MIQTIQNNWLSELKHELQGTDCIRIVSPFVKDNIVKHLLDNFIGSKIQLITRFNLNDFYSGASSITALEHLINQNAEIKGVKDLHSKLYLFDKKSVIITSANFTNGGFFRNKEFGIKSYSEDTIEESITYFQELWEIDNEFLTMEKLEKWKSLVRRTQNLNNSIELLPDYGKSYQEKIIGTGKRYFIKFFGKNEYRAPLDYHSRTEIEDAHCHYTLSFSRKSNDKRPRKYRDGDIVYMAMMLHGNDYAIFGKGVTYAHNDQRDVASEKDIQHVPWRKAWSILIRVHSTEFIDSTMRNCPKMSWLINELDYECFDKTLKRHNKGEKDINPWNSLRQQADVQLSELGALWLEERFEKTIKAQGKVPQSFINQFYQGRKL